jgi:hypothetical protein
VLQHVSCEGGGGFRRFIQGWERGRVIGGRGRVQGEREPRVGSRARRAAAGRTGGEITERARPLALLHLHDRRVRGGDGGQQGQRRDEGLQGSH